MAQRSLYDRNPLVFRLSFAKRERASYFIAPKRLSNEFDDTIGAEPET